jgi:hypothetical protein
MSLRGSSVLVTFSSWEPSYLKVEHCFGVRCISPGSLRLGESLSQDTFQILGN